MQQTREQIENVQKIESHEKIFVKLQIHAYFENLEK